MNLERVVVGKGETNCYILSDNNKIGIIIDPGFEGQNIQAVIENKNIKPKMIILTHYHYDHVGAVDYLKSIYNIPVYIHKNGKDGLKDPLINRSRLRLDKDIIIEADELLEDGEILEVGDLKLKVIYTPGHTKSDICILIDDIIFTGDTLFKNSIGRTDLEDGDYDLIKKSIIEKLLPLNDNLIVYPGHYYDSTLKREKIYNPKLLNF